MATILFGCSEPPMYIKTDSHTYICKMGCQNYPSWLKNPKVKTKLWRPKKYQAPHCFDQCRHKPIKKWWYVEIIKWTFGILIGAIFFYILFVIVNSKIQEMDNKKSTFKCQYISGKCKVKVTEKNCSGGLPVSYCEGKLNGRW